ncbi:hypothetical protein OB905_00555 [Halobacteria archaeon AArc-dxtr1]|nr:hypothetical protein [Halobacteria archaeon AArc-dxtr1]
MSGTHESETTAFENGPLTPTRIAGGAAVMDVVVFAAIGYLVFENVLVGGLSGLLVGLGVYLILPVFFQSGEDGELSDLVPENDAAPLRGFHRLAAGYALSASGIVLFASAFAEFELYIGVLGAIVAAAVIYIAAGFVMPNAQLQR